MNRVARIGGRLVRESSTMRVLVRVSAAFRHARITARDLFLQLLRWSGRQRHGVGHLREHREDAHRPHELGVIGRGLAEAYVPRTSRPEFCGGWRLPRKKAAHPKRPLDGGQTVGLVNDSLHHSNPGGVPALLLERLISQVCPQPVANRACVLLELRIYEVLVEGVLANIDLVVGPRLLLVLRKLGKVARLEPDSASIRRGHRRF